MLEFTRTGASGRSMDLPGGYCLTREFDRIQLGISVEPGGENPLVLEGPAPSVGEMVAGGKKFKVVWGDAAPEGCGEVLEVVLSTLEFPLMLRGWMPGDRIALSYGTKKLKK